MGERADELREEIDAQRGQMGRTVGQIENRVMPGRVIARGRYRVRQRIVDARDRLMGNEEEHYPWERTEPRGFGDPQGFYDRHSYDPTGHSSTQDGGSSDHSDDGPSRGQQIASSISDSASSAADAVSNAPQAVRQKARGNPLAAGLVAFGAGLLAAAVLPESRREQRAVSQIEPMLTDAISAGADQAREMVDDMAEPAKEAVEDMKHAGSDSVSNVKETATEEAKGAAEDVRS